MADSKKRLPGADPPAARAIIPAGQGGPGMLETSDLLMDEGPVSAMGSVQPGMFTAVSVHSLLRQKWLILAVFTLVAGASIPCIWLFTVPLYQSTALIRVQPVVPKVAFSTENNGMVPLYRDYMNTQVNLVRNPKVLQRVVELPEVMATHWYREEGKRLLRDPLPPLTRLNRALDVRMRPNTQLIGVSMSTQVGSEAKLIVDAVVKTYDELIRGQERQDYLDLIKKVREQYVTVEGEIKDLRLQRDLLSQDRGLTDSLELRNQLSTELNQLESQRREIDRDLKLLKARLEDARAGTTQPAGDQPDALVRDGPDYAQDAEWRGLNLACKQAQHELDLAREQYGAGHVKIKQLTADVEYAQARLSDREVQLNKVWEDRAGTDPAILGPDTSPMSPEATQRIITDKEHEKNLLLVDINDLRPKVDEVRKLALNEEQLQEKKQVFDVLRNRLTALEMEATAPGRISIDALGVQPFEPASDRRPLLTAMALAGAGMLALALGYLRCLSDPRIHEVSEVQNMTQAPFLGRLPALAKAAIPKELGGFSSLSLQATSASEVGHGTYPDPNSPTALFEGVRMIRTALLERLGHTSERAILITSPTSRAGKTSLALLLARSLTATGKSVLLVEGDFYRPSLAPRLGLNASAAGLAALLNRAVDDAGAIQATDVPLLSVLPAGDIPESFSTEVLSNGIFAECMMRWRQRYDYIIVDTPPVLPVADARILAAHVDGALLVLRAAHNRRAEAWSAFSQLSSTRGGVLGVIMIGGEAAGAGRYYRDAGYAYAVSPGRAAPDDGNG